MYCICLLWPPPPLKKEKEKKIFSQALLYLAHLVNVKWLVPCHRTIESIRKVTIKWNLCFKTEILLIYKKCSSITSCPQAYSVKIEMMFVLCIKYTVMLILVIDCLIGRHHKLSGLSKIIALAFEIWNLYEV